MAGAPISKAHQHQSHHNEPRYKAYFAQAQRDHNKALKIARHLERFPWDGKALEALRNLSILAVKRAGVKIPDNVSLSPAHLRRKAGVTLTGMKKARMSMADLPKAA